ncbi:MAG: gluconokinase [Acidibacillus sp.]|nr:gluconokinase [Acidibacillus sp.]
MSDSEVLVGIDIGTTSVKALAEDGSGVSIARAVRTIDTVSEQEQQAEQDPYDIYRAVQAVVREVGEVVMASGRTITHIGMSAAMHSLMVIDDAGNPLTPLYTWMDLRAKEVSQALLATDAGARRYRRTGTPVHAMTPAVKLQWLRTHKPALFEAGHRFVSCKEWLWWLLFGEYVVDESIASATGLLNLSTRQWDEETLTELAIPASSLSRIVSTTYTRHGMDMSGIETAGVSKDTAVTIGASDGVLANLALGITESENMVLTMGTSLAVRTGSHKIVSDPIGRPFCYILDDTTYIVGGPSNSGGIVLEWVANHCGHGDQGTLAERLTALFAEAEHVLLDDLYFLPYVAGERAPLWNENAQASFIGLKASDQPAHLFRAAMEGILYNARWIAEQLMVAMDEQPSIVVVSGRPFEHAWVQQLTADIFSIPVRVAQADDASTKGAIAMARMAHSAAHLQAITRTLVKTTGAHAASRTIVPDDLESRRHALRFAHFQMLVKHLIPSV